MVESQACLIDVRSYPESGHQRSDLMTFQRVIVDRAPCR